MHVLTRSLTCSATQLCLLTLQVKAASAQALPRKQHPGANPGPAQSLQAGESYGPTGSRTGQSPEMLAAAQAFLQGQLQEMGIPSGHPHPHPQLLSVITALTGASGGASSTPPPAPAPTSLPPGPTNAVMQFSKAASEPVVEMNKAAKLSRGGSIRKQESRGTQEGGYLHGRPLGVAPRNLPSRDSEQKDMGYQNEHQLSDAQAHAAAYAQQLYALLAQAQVAEVCRPTLHQPMLVRATLSAIMQRNAHWRCTEWRAHSMYCTASSAAS